MQTDTSQSAADWGREEFGRAKLGNSLRTARLVKIATGAAERPAGKVTEVFESSADLEAAYRHLGSKRGGVDATAAAAHDACAARCAASGAPFAYVPVDGTSLNITDRTHNKGLGPIGARSKKARGVQVMNAIAVAADGIPAGVCGQVYWAREEKKPRPARQRPFEEKESRHWLGAMMQAQDAFARSGGDCIPWYQCDRGGDFQELLCWTVDNTALVTVRVNHDRLVDDADAHRLRELIEQQPSAGRYILHVPGGSKRKERDAEMEVRFCEAPVVVGVDADRRELNFHLVQTREVGTTPSGEDPINWLLLTTFPVQSYDDAVEVIRGYSQRWRVEEHHKTWKSCCRVEETQLRDFESIVLWATILASVAIRIERLKYMARVQPDRPADTELSRDELDAVILLSRTPDYEVGDTPSVGIVMRWIADLGGYTGKSSGGPPGSIVLARGLRRVEVAMQLIDILR